MVTPYYEDKNTLLFCGDAFVITPQLRPYFGNDSGVGLVLTDPPYSAAVHKNAKRGYADDSYLEGE